ncbi:single-stranded nucleic acid-binding protein, partial [Haematococcus lacustris]
MPASSLREDGLLDLSSIILSAPASRKAIVCQVDGCGKDLAGLSSKSYTVRHKCCADHLRACTVTVAGVLS